MLKYFITSLFFVLVIYSCRPEENSQIPDELILEMRGNANQFLLELKTVLISEIQTNGLVSAVSVCSDTAQILTNDYATRKGIYIKRVSMKNRNENNFPDVFEVEGLNYFQKILDQGKLDSLSEYSRIVVEDDVKYLRYMKPIVVQAPCLNCHGKNEQIIPEVHDLINNFYKNDKAKNYNIGDLRGAISIQKVY